MGNSSSRSAASAPIIRGIAAIALAGCLLTASACSDTPDPAPGSSTSTTAADPAAPTVTPAAAPPPSAPAGASPGADAVADPPADAVVETTAAADVQVQQGDAGVLDAGELGAAVDQPMPDLVGLPVASAILALSNHEVAMTDASGAAVSAAADDLVCRQTPAAGQVLDRPVVLVIATTC